MKFGYIRSCQKLQSDRAILLKKKKKKAMKTCMEIQLVSSRCGFFLEPSHELLYLTYII